MESTYTSPVLEAGLAIETIKHYVPIFLDKAVTWLDDTATKLDNKYGGPYPCTGNWMCLRETVRHKAGCPGKTVPIDQYVRGLR